MWAHPPQGCCPSDSSQGLGCGKSGESGQGVSAGRFTFGSGVGLPGCQACSSVLEMPTRGPLQVTGLSFVCVYVAHKLLQVTGLSFWVWCVCVCVSCDPMDCSPPGSSVHGNSLGKNTGVDCHSLLQGIFPSQGSNLAFPHFRQILYHLNHQGSPKLLVESCKFLHIECMSLEEVSWDVH